MFDCPWIKHTALSQICTWCGAPGGRAFQEMELWRFRFEMEDSHPHKSSRSWPPKRIFLILKGSFKSVLNKQGVKPGCWYSPSSISGFIHSLYTAQLITKQPLTFSKMKFQKSFYSNCVRFRARTTALLLNLFFQKHEVDVAWLPQPKDHVILDLGWWVWAPE